jgi:hypothetical protein
MCAPALAVVSIITTMAAAAMQAKAQYDQGQFQEGMAKNNATLANRAATDASVRGAYAAGVNNMKASQTIGQGVAEAGAAGVDVSIGAPVETAATTRMMSSLDSEMLRYNAEAEASGFRQKASDYGAEGRFAAYKGGQGAFASVLGGASGAYSGYTSGVSAGLFPKFGA